MVWRSPTPAIHIQAPLFLRVQWFLGYSKLWCLHVIPTTTRSKGVWTSLGQMKCSVDWTSNVSFKKNNLSAIRLFLLNLKSPHAQCMELCLNSFQIYNVGKYSIDGSSGKRTQSGQIIIFHQPRFSWNKGIPLSQLHFGVRLCEVAIIWPGTWQVLKTFGNPLVPPCSTWGAGGPIPSLSGI